MCTGIHFAGYNVKHLQGELPLAAALKGRDEGGVGHDVGGAALLLHEVEQVPRLLPLPACKSLNFVKPCTLPSNVHWSSDTCRVHISGRVARDPTG